MRLITLLLVSGYLSSVVLLCVGTSQLPQQAPATYTGDPAGLQAFNEAQRQAFMHQTINSAGFKMTMVSVGIFIITGAIHLRCRSAGPVLPMYVEPPQDPQPLPPPKSILKPTPSPPQESPPAFLHYGPAITYITGRPKILTNPPGV